MVPPELQQGLCRRWHAVLWPGKEMELCDRAGFPGALVLQVEAADEVVVAPDVFTYKVHLEIYDKYWYCVFCYRLGTQLLIICTHYK